MPRILRVDLIYGGAMHTHALTTFVAARSQLHEATKRYADRVRRIYSHLATIVSIDDLAQPVQDSATLWDLRATAVYEGIENADELELFRLGCVLEHDKLTEEETEQLVGFLFFCGPEEPDPFPANVELFTYDSPSVGAHRRPLPNVLVAGTNLLTVHGLVPRGTDPHHIFDRAIVGLDARLAGPLTQADNADPDIFGPLVVAEVHRAVAGQVADYPPARAWMRQRLVVEHSGQPVDLEAPDGLAVAYEVEPLQ